MPPYDPYTRVPWSNRPLGCTLCSLPGGVPVAYRFLIPPEVLRTRPGQLEMLGNRCLIVVDVGPFPPGMRPRYAP